jgi:hypothetical protein
MLRFCRRERFSPAAPLLTRARAEYDGYKMKWGSTELGPIGFQTQITPLWFRNIFIKPLP